MEKQSLKEVFERKKCLIAYLMVGDPDLEGSARIIEKAAITADIIELGVPFSDPIADGPVIQQAAGRAMAAGARISHMLELVGNMRQKGIKTPIITMLYYNLVHSYGVENFVKDIKKAGLNGALIPDLPLEESGKLRELLKINGLDFPMLVTPATPFDRAKEIAGVASGFIYFVAYTGTTGSGAKGDYAGLEKQVAALRRECALPMAVGFGIKDRESVEQVWRFADGAVVGSALIEVVAHNNARGQAPQKVEEFIHSLRG